MENNPPDSSTPWYVGHHDSQRGLPVSDSQLRQAQEAGYDMLTSPMTTPHFRSSVVNLASTFYKALDSSSDLDSLPVPLVPALKPIDSTLTPSESISQLIITAAPWIDLASADPIIANISQQVLNLEVAYAAFCGVQHVIIQGPTLGSASRITQFARAVQTAIGIGPYIQFHLLFSLGRQKASEAENPRNLAHFARHHGENQVVSEWSSWEAWHSIRQFCNYNARLSVALKLQKQHPPFSVISRWAAEPIRLIFVPQAIFTPNKHNQPVLHKTTQNLLYRFMRLRSAPWIFLSDVGPIPTTLSSSDSIDGARLDPDASSWPEPADSAKTAKKVASIASDPTPHLTYIKHHLQVHQPAKSLVERFGQGYQDYLQAPLQPLADNLESITYEVFEKDPIKYEWYERAIYSALGDWSTEEKPTSSPDGAVVIAVVGSGRGPLVTRALRASQATGVAVQVWAIEKNPNAYVLLQRHNEFEWGRQVNVVKTDMRSWRGPQLPDGTFAHVDILVSELLGSFADNELSPECLDGVQHVLAPDYGISIPASYTAHLTPISTPKLHADLLHKGAADKEAFNLPYVVMLHQHDFLSTIPASTELRSSSDTATTLTNETVLTPNVQTCWEFKHPIPPTILAQANLRRGGSAAGGYGGTHGGDGANEHNARACLLTFPCAHRGTCHGLAGYFETVLYTSTDLEDDGEGEEGSGSLVSVELSTNPVTMDKKSKDMISWFPIYFPLREPVSFPDDAEVDVSMWRCTDDRKVWYEWCVEAFIRLASGERVRVGGGQMQSSQKNGCLM